MDTYNFMIHTCTQIGDLRRAEFYLKMMDMSGFQPNLVSFNMMINACAAAGDESRAEEWLRWILRRGMKPSEVTYGTVCNSFASKGDVQAVERIMLTCVSTGSALNEYFYASLIRACGACRPPDLVRAEKAFMELVNSGLIPQRVKRGLCRVVGNTRASGLMIETSDDIWLEEEGWKEY